MALFSLSWRYDGEPHEDLYGLIAKMNRKEQKTIDEIGGMTREVSQLIIDTVRANWSIGSPAEAGAPPAMVSGNLDSSARIYERDLTGRFSSSTNSRTSSIIWDARVGNAYHGRGEYAAVQEYGMDGLLAPHPFLAPALARVESGFMRRLRAVIDGR